MTTGRINQVAAFKELITKRPKPQRERIQLKKQHSYTKNLCWNRTESSKDDSEWTQGTKLRLTFHQRTPTNRRDHDS